MQLDNKNEWKASDLERRVKVTSCFIASSPRSVTLVWGGSGGYVGPAHSVTHRAASGPHNSMGSSPGGWGAWRARKEGLPRSLLSWPTGVSLWGSCVLRSAGGVEGAWPSLRGLMRCLRTGKQRVWLSISWLLWGLAAVLSPALWASCCQWSESRAKGLQTRGACELAKARGNLLLPRGH